MNNNTFNERKEFNMMRKMYNNNVGVHDHMDLLTFAWNYYNGQVMKFTELRNFWRVENIMKFMQENKPKKKVVIKRKTTNKGDK